MTYIVAKSYENLTQIGNPFDRNGKKYIKVKERCSRCGGTGHYPSLEWNGICIKCGGAGYVTKDVSVYTESERLNLDKAAERARVKAAEKRLAKAAEVRQKSYRFHGFDNEGNGFIVCSRHTYELKDDIKAHDGRWNGDFSIWIVPNAFAPNSDNDIIFVPCKFFDFYDINNNWTCYRDEAKDRVKSILAENMESLPDDSEGEWVGKIGERLRNLPATVEGIDFNSK